MAYEAIPLVMALAMPLLAGLALIVDAVRRAVHELRGSDHGLHLNYARTFELSLESLGGTPSAPHPFGDDILS